MKIRADSELDISLKAGPNAATLEHNNRENRYGITGGLAGDRRWLLTDRLVLAGQAELLYTPRGAKAVLDGMDEGGSRAHYLDVVVAVRPEMQLNSISLYLLLGGSLNFLISASTESAAGVSQDITGDLHRLDVSLLGGVGVALHLSPKDSGSFHIGSVFLEARHDIGLLDTDAVNGGFKNRTSSIMLGLAFVVSSATPPATSSALSHGSSSTHIALKNH